MTSDIVTYLTIFQCNNFINIGKMTTTNRENNTTNSKQSKTPFDWFKNVMESIDVFSAKEKMFVN